MTNFFIIGNPRSGTSLLRLILNAHNNILVPPECGHILWWYDKYGTWSEKDGNDINSIKQYLDDLSTSKKFNTWNIDIKNYADNILNRSPSSYQELIQAVYAIYSNELSKNMKIWGDKNNYYIRHLDKLHAYFPNYKYVYIIRDGRDVASSYINLSKKNITSIYQPDLPTDIDKISARWNENIKNIYQHYNNNKEISTLIKYEDLVTNPDVVMRNICSFLGIKYSEDILLYYQKENNNEPKEYSEWKYKNQNPITPNYIGQYKNTLSQEQIKKFNESSYKWLNLFNYPL